MDCWSEQLSFTCKCKNWMEKITLLLLNIRNTKLINSFILHLLHTWCYSACVFDTVVTVRWRWLIVVQDNESWSEEKKAERRTGWGKMRQAVVEVSQTNGSVAEQRRAEGPEAEGEKQERANRTLNATLEQAWPLTGPLGLNQQSGSQPLGSRGSYINACRYARMTRWRQKELSWETLDLREEERGTTQRHRGAGK